MRSFSDKPMGKGIRRGVSGLSSPRVGGGLFTIFVWARLGTFPFFYNKRGINNKPGQWETCLGLARPSLCIICPPHPTAPPALGSGKAPSAQPWSFACTVPSVPPSPARPFLLSLVRAYCGPSTALGARNTVVVRHEAPCLRPACSPVGETNNK